MEQIINVNVDTQTVSARELYCSLKIKSNFTTWFKRMCEYDFLEGNEFFPKMEETSETGGRPSADYAISVDMAKQICMIQRTPEGKQVRQYLIDLEKAWNTPEQVMARALKIADKQISDLKAVNQVLLEDNQRMKPKEVFADAVSASDTSILIRDLAKMIKQNGVPMGEKRLYKWLREKGYICKNATTPTQKAMELGLFETVVRTVNRGDRLPLETVTTKVTGKGQ